MADWGSRARDRDRDEAIALVEAAAARGLIIDADKRQRIDSINTAVTVGEIDLVTRGLQAQLGPGADPADGAWAPTPTSPAPSGAMPVGSAYPPPQVEYGEPVAVSTVGAGVATPTPTKLRGCLFVVLAVLTLGIGGVIAVVVTFFADGIDDVTSTDSPAGSGGVSVVDLISEEGLTDLVDAIEEEHGSSEVFEAVLYPEYGLVRVPAEPTGQREIAYSWRGTLEESTRGSSIREGRIDLRRIDAVVLNDLLTEAERLVKDANAGYVIVHAPGTNDQGAAIFAYAANDYGEGAYVSARVNGKVVRRVTW